LRGGVRGGGLPAGKSAFESLPDPQRIFDLSDDPVPLLDDLIVREPQRPIADLREPCLARLIPLRFVERTVQLDDQADIVAGEVCDKPADRDLAAEVQAVGLAKGPEPGPEATFPAGRVVAKPARESDVLRAADAPGRRVRRG
jgi:hypothetical protein